MKVNRHSMPPVQLGVRRASRVYRVQATRQAPAGSPPSDLVTTALRIHTVVCAMFRRYFETAPSFIWAEDGRSAEAWDDRGNRVHVTQLNHR